MMIFKNKKRKIILVRDIIPPGSSNFLYIKVKEEWKKPNGIFKKAVMFSLMIVLISSQTYLFSAFEAHVINVTAKIELPPMCNALSIGYWRNHEGCIGKGSGSSDWTSQVNALSSTFSGVFSSYTGENICQNLWIPDCPSGNTVESKLCKAKAQVLGNELNVVSSRQSLNALLAGADDGDSAFDHLGLSASSTVEAALVAAEAIIVNASSTKAQLTDAAYVAMRIYSFYEDENPKRPYCIFDLTEIPECGDYRYESYGVSSEISVSVEGGGSAIIVSDIEASSSSTIIISGDYVSTEPPQAILGCMDEDAENYNPNVTGNDNSCVYTEIETLSTEESLVEELPVIEETLPQDESSPEEQIESVSEETVIESPIVPAVEESPQPPAE